jgi:hypothetical protein
VLKNSVSAPNVKFWGIENVLRSEKIAYIASWRNFIFAIFAEMSFSTATRFITTYGEEPAPTNPSSLYPF